MLALLLWSLGAAVLNLCTFDRIRPGSRPPLEAPFVSILVPARNEAENIAPCVRSLLAQDYPFFELLVLDDHSTDSTANIVQGLGVSASGTISRLITGEPLPPEWTGKGWACQQLASASRGSYLWYVDADTEHDPGALSALIDYATKKRASLVSAWPRLVTKTWSEKLVIPMLLLLGMTLYPHWLVILLQRFPGAAGRLPARWRRMLGAANGQSMLWTHDAYAAIGGHGAVHDHVVEDVALGRAVAARMHEGFRLFNCDGTRISSCRMYRSFGEVWEGFTKNVRAAFETSLAGFIVIGFVQACCFLLPFAWLIFPGHAWHLVAAQVAVIYSIRALLTWRFSTSWFGCILHPAGHALAMAIGLNSWFRTSGPGVLWKGRTYRPRIS